MLIFHEVLISLYIKGFLHIAFTQYVLFELNFSLYFIRKVLL